MANPIRKRLLDLRQFIDTATGTTGARILSPVGDDVPRNLAEPLRVDVLQVEMPATVTTAPGFDTSDTYGQFAVIVRAADGARVPDLWVQVRIDGPTRTAVLEMNTDLRGRAEFRLTDGPGAYTLTPLDVGGGRLTWQRIEPVTAAV